MKNTNLQIRVFNCISSHIGMLSEDLKNKELGYLYRLCKQVSEDKGLELSDAVISKWFPISGICGHNSKTDPDEWSGIKKEIPGIVLEQVYETDGQFNVKRVLGFAFSVPAKPITLQEYKKGGYISHVRTSTFAMPYTLKVGDVLATGQVVVSDPRGDCDDRENVILHVSLGKDEQWLIVSKNVPVALQPKKPAKKKH